MIESSAIASVFRGGLWLLYWLLSAGAIAFVVWKSKTKRAKLIGALITISAFTYLPAKTVIERSQRIVYEKEAWAYFKKKCDTEAGEKIYKTYTGVRSVLVVKALPPATEKDLYDQFWYGDPYSDATPWDKRGVDVARRLTSDSRRPNGMVQRGLDFVEIQTTSGTGYVQIRRVEYRNKEVVREEINQPTSRFSVLWEDISKPEDRKYWVAGSRMQVVDLADGSIIAERIGFLIEAGFGSKAGKRRPWLAARGVGPNGRSCPIADEYSDQWFITNVFEQNREK